MANQQQDQKQKQGPGDPPTDVIGALREMYSGFGHTVKDEDLQATAKAYAGKEADMWRSVMDAQEFEYTQEDIDYLTATYSNPYSLQKKNPGGTGSDFSGGQNTDPSNALTAGGSTPSNESPGSIDVPLSRESSDLNRFFERSLYGTNNRDYDGLEQEVDRQLTVKTDAGAMLFQAGMITDEERFNRELKLKEDAAKKRALIASKKRTNTPINPSSVLDDNAPSVPEDRPELNSLYGRASTYFNDLMPKIDAVYDLVTQQAPSVLGTDIETADEVLRDITVRHQNVVSGYNDGSIRGYTGNVGSGIYEGSNGALGSDAGAERWRELSEKYPQFAVGIDQAINADTSPLNDALVDAAQPKIDQYFGEVPSVVTDKMRDVFLTMNPDFKPGDFAERGNPLNILSGALADDYLDKSGIELDDRERQAVRRRLEQIVKSSYRNKIAREKAMSVASENGLVLPSKETMSRVDKEVQRLDAAMTAQAVELRDQVDARLGTMKSEYEASVSTFKAGVKLESEALASKLRKAVESQEISQEDADAAFESYHSAKQEEANELTKEWSGRMSNAASNFDRQRRLLISQFDEKQADILAQAGYSIDDDGNIDADVSSKEMIAELINAQAQVLVDRDNRAAQEEYRGLSTGEKVARGLGNGFIQIFEGIGLGSEWLGASDFGYEYAREWRNLGYNEPLLDMGEFEWEQMEDPDWWYTKAVPMIPLLGALAATGGTGGMMGSSFAGAAELGTLGTLISTSTGAAVASRFTEGLMESGQRYEKSLSMGKTPEEAKADGASVFKRNMMLIGLDAMQVFSVLKFADKVNDATKQASRLKTAATFSGGLGANVVTEAGEEWWQGYADYRIDNPAQSFLGLSNIGSYIQSPEGMEAGVLGGIFGSGFYVGGTAATTLAGYTAKEVSSFDENSGKTKEQQITGRGQQLFSTINLLNRRGVISDEVAQQSIKELVVATETQLKIERGEGRIDQDHRQRTKYVEMMARSAGLELAAERTQDEAERGNIEREIRELRDQMQEIEKYSPEIADFSLDGIPVAPENLRSVLSSPDLASKVSASSVQMNGNPLEIVSTADAAANLESGVNDDLQAMGEQAVTDAIITLANNPELAGDYTALEQKANNALATGEKGHADKWGIVSEVIAKAKSGVAYPALQPLFTSESSAQSVGVNTATAAREGVEDSTMQPTVNDGTDNASDQLQARRAARSQEITNDYFTSMFDVREIIMAVKEKFPKLASSVEGATSSDDISSSDKAKFVKAAMQAQRSGLVNIRDAVRKARSNGQRNQVNTPNETNKSTPTFSDPLSQDSQVGVAETNVPDEVAQDHIRRSQLSNKFLLDGAMMALLAQRDPSLHSAVMTDPGMQSLSNEQVESLELLVSQTAGTAVLQPNTMNEWSRDKAAKTALQDSSRSAQDLRNVIDGNAPSKPIETIVTQAAMFGIEWSRVFGKGNDRTSESVSKYRDSQQKRVDTVTTLTARALAFIRESAILRPSKGVVKYTDFMSVLRDELTTDQLSKVDSDATRSAFNRARREYKLQSDNPIEYNSVLSARDRFIRWIADARVGLRRFEQHLSKMGFDGKAAMKELQKDRPAEEITLSVYNDLQGIQGRINYQSRTLDEKVYGVSSGEIGAQKINQESWVNNIFEQTGLQLDDVSLYFYAKHAQAFNERIRKISRERLNDRIKELNNKLEEAQAEYRLHTTNGDNHRAQLAAQRVSNWSDQLADAIANEDSVGYEIEQGSGMSDADAVALLDHYNAMETREGSSETMEQFMEKQYAWFKENVIDARIHIARDAGLISQETAENILEGRRPVYVRDVNGDRVIGQDGQYEVEYEDGFKDYVPLRVNNEDYLDARDPNDEADSQGTTGTATILSAEGTVDFDFLKRNDPIAQAMADFNATIEIAERNKSYRTILEMAKAIPDPSLWQVVPSSGMVSVDESGHITGFNDFTSPHIKKHSVPVMVDGKIQYLYFKPERQVNMKSVDRFKKAIGMGGSEVEESVLVPSSILTALTQPDKSKVGSSALIGVMRTYMNFKRGMTTQWNPIFGFKNITRDMATLIFNTSSTETPVNQRDLRRSIYKNYAKSMLVVGKRGIKGFKNVDTDPMSVESLWAEAIEYGLPMSWSNYESVDARQKKYNDILASQGRPGFDREGYGRTTMRYIARRMERLNDVMENTARLAAYASLRQNGVNIKDAVAASKDITVNFERHGNFTPILNTFWLFANAGVQDAYRSSRTFGSKKAMKAAAGLFATYFMMGAFFSWLESLDGEDNKRTPFQRSNNLIFPTGTGIVGTIPKPYGQPRFWMNAGMYTQRMIDGRDRPRDAISGMFGDMIAMFDPVGASSANPVSALSPTLLQTPAQYAMNMNFMGGKMYNDFPGMETIDKTGRTPQYLVDKIRDVNNLFQTTVLGEIVPVPEIPPVLVYEMIRDFGGSVGGEMINTANLFMGDTPNGELASTPLLRSFAVNMDEATSRAMSTIYEQNRFSAYHPPNDTQIEAAIKSYSDIVDENEKREEMGEEPIVKWTSLNYQRKLYMKFGIDLASGERWEVPEYKGLSEKQLRDQEN